MARNTTLDLPTAELLRSAPRPLTFSAVALAMMTAALWGGTPVAISYSVDTLPAVAVAGWRFVMAAGFMLVWCWVEKSPIWPRPGQWLRPMIAGALLFFQISLFNLGVQYSNSTNGSLLINTFVFWVVLLEHFITHSDRLSLRKSIGLLVAAAGVVVVLLISKQASPLPIDPLPEQGRPIDLPSLWGDALLVLSALILGIKIVYIKQSLRVVEPGKMVLWHDVFGVVLFFAYSGLFEEVHVGAFTLPAVLGLVYQGVLVGGLCFAVQAMLLQRHSASQVSVFSFSTPLFGVLAGVLMRGDEPSPLLFVSGICVAAGILLVNWPARSVETSKDWTPPAGGE